MANIIIVFINTNFFSIFFQKPFYYVNIPNQLIAINYHLSTLYFNYI